MFALVSMTWENGRGELQEMQVDEVQASGDVHRTPKSGGASLGPKGDDDVKEPSGVCQAEDV